MLDVWQIISTNVHQEKTKLVCNAKIRKHMQVFPLKFYA